MTDRGHAGRDAGVELQGAVRRVLWITLALNLVNFAIKLGVGFFSRNLTVLSDAVHGLLDASNNVVGIFVLRYSWKPPDASHPYGHRKFEALASLAIGGLMALTSWEILKSVLDRYFRHSGTTAPSAPTALWLGLVGVGLVINVFITIYEARRGRALRSMFLLADAAHTKSDVFVTIMSLSSLILAPRLPWVDGLLSLTVVGLIVRTGWTVVRDNILLLTDSAQIDPARIRQVVEALDDVKNCHAVRTSGMPDAVHLDLHIVVRPDLSAAEAHEIEHRVRQALQAEFPEIRDVSIQHQTHLPGETAAG